MNETRPRPHFLPPQLNWEELPDNVRAALEDIILPLHNDYVRGNRESLQRSIGASLVFLACEETLDQFSLGSSRIPGGPEPAADRAKEIDRYLRLLGAKQKTAALLERLIKARREANAD